MMTEAQIQAQLIQWWQRAHRGLGVPDARLLIMIPNGAYLGAGVKQTRGGRSVPLAAIRFAQLKRQGFVQGAPDLFLAVPGNGAHGLFVEMKRERRGTVSAAQSEMHALLLTEGYAVCVARGFEEAVEEITTYLVGRSMAGGPRP
jgi:hypothetical protein